MFNQAFFYKKNSDKLLQQMKTKPINRYEMFS